jgi:hypothetical protein
MSTAVRSKAAINRAHLIKAQLGPRLAVNRVSNGRGEWESTELIPLFELFGVVDVMIPESLDDGDRARAEDGEGCEPLSMQARGAVIAVRCIALLAQCAASATTMDSREMVMVPWSFRRADDRRANEQRSQAENLAASWLTGAYVKSCFPRRSWTPRQRRVAERRCLGAEVVSASEDLWSTT